MKKIKNNIQDFFKWVKGTELVELNDIDVSKDPVRPELTLDFRTTHGRKIFGLKYNNEIEAIICIAFCPVRSPAHKTKSEVWPYLSFLQRAGHMHSDRCEKPQ